MTPSSARPTTYAVNQTKRAEELEDWTIIGCFISASVGIVTGIVILYLACR